MRDIEALPMVTTVVGSYPVDGLPPRRAIQRAVEDQIAAGIDLISDGQVRGDILAQSAARIPGFRRADDGVWEITDALDLPDTSSAATDYAFARSLAAGRAELKGVITGPVTLALTSRVAPSAPYTNSADPALILRLTEILGHEVAALVAAGARAVQVDEPALGAALGVTVTPELAHDALRDLAALPRFPILHVCGDVRRVAEELLVLPFAVLDIENASFDNLAAFDPDQLEFVSTVVSVGCVATDDEAVEPVTVVRGRVEAALARLPAERIWLSPDCGMRNLSRETAKAKLAVLAEAAQDARAAL